MIGSVNSTGMTKSITPAMSLALFCLFFSAEGLSIAVQIVQGKLHETKVGMIIIFYMIQKVTDKQ